MIPYAKEAGAALVLAAILGAGWAGWEWRDRSADAEMATLVAQRATERHEAAERLAQFEAMAREQERRHAADMDRIAQEYLEELSNAKAESDRVVAQLRDGTLRLQDRWRGCGEPSPVPDFDAGTRAPDAVTIDREASAARIVHAARECDAQVRGLQSVIRKDRGQ